jgi:F-type H+-transporting ATPase subunit gamma
MVLNLQQIKKKLQVANNIAKLSKVIELMSISKLYKKQNLLKSHNIYTKHVRCMLQNSIENTNLINNQYMNNMNSKKLLYIIFPDKGLCGNIITKLYKKVNSYLTYNDNYYIIIVGKKAKNIFIKNSYTIIASFDTGISNDELIYKLMEVVTKFFAVNRITKINIAYTKFKDLFNQEAIIEEIWPIKKSVNINKQNSYIIEPNIQKILLNLLPYYIKISLNNALINACISEQAARIIAMKNSRDNAYNILLSLTNFYNKARQEKITNDILDLSNGNEYRENII